MYSLGPVNVKEYDVQRGRVVQLTKWKCVWCEGGAALELEQQRRGCILVDPLTIEPFPNAFKRIKLELRVARCEIY